MDTRKPGATTEMQVTSIRLESELKERLREISGEQGYQSLIREVLWQFVTQHQEADEERSTVVASRRSVEEGMPTPNQMHLLCKSEIRATFRAIAQQEEQCAITGQPIRPRQPMGLGLTATGELVPLCLAIVE